MNVERLHLIALELHSDLASSGLVSALSELGVGLSNLANQPGDPAQQQAVSNAREAVRASIVASGVDMWPAAWRATLEDLGVDYLLGANLSQSIEDAISANEITPSTASAAVSALADQLASLDQSLTAMITVFERFGIATEDLEVGEAEVSVMIPRDEVGERLDDLGREFEQLNRILGVFVEIETGSREPMRLRAIASSDYGVYLETAVQVGAFIAVSIERLLPDTKRSLRFEYFDRAWLTRAWRMSWPPSTIA